MTSFKLLAQSFTTSQRITKTVSANSEQEAVRLVARQLDEAGFYLIDVKAQ